MKRLSDNIGKDIKNNIPLHLSLFHSKKIKKKFLKSQKLSKAQNVGNKT